jgi:hypothetical protein
MKKRLSLITALALAATMSVGAVVPKGEIADLSALQSTNGRVALTNDAKKLLLNKSINISKKAPSLAKRNGSSITDLDDNTTETPAIITEAPKGETVQYVRSAGAFYVFWGAYLMYENVEGNITEMVFGEDGSVYFKDPISEFATDSYIKGTLKDDVITFELPQPIVESGGETYYASLQDIAVDWDSGSFENKAADSQTIKFSYKDGVISQLDGENIYLSITDSEGEWAYYGDTDIVLTPFKDESIQTVDLASKDYQFIYTDEDGVAGGHIVSLAKDDSNVYVKGISEYSDAWIKGTISGNKVTVETQSLGVVSSTLLYAIPAKVNEVSEYYEDYGYYTYNTYTPLDKIEFTYDADKDTYTAEDGVAIITYNALPTEDIDYAYEAFINPIIKPQGDVSNSVPADPTISSFTDYSSYYGYTIYFFDFVLSKMSTDGDILDVDKLYYNVFFDGEVETYDPETYDVEEEITDLPFTYSTTYDIYGSGLSKSLSVYSEGFETIGVQTIYRPEEGKEIRSNLIEYVVETGDILVNGESTAGVSNIAADKAVKSEVYYDLTGRRVVNPENGLYIKKVTYEDNTVKVSKIAK